MRKSTGLALLLALVTSAGCVQRSAYVDPASRVDNMLHFTEQDRHGVTHPVSSEELDDEHETTRVPSPALVDIDSQLRIHVAKPPGEAATEIVGAEGAEVLERKRRLTAIMTALDGVLSAREGALEAFRSDPDGDATDELIRELSRQKLAFIREFRELDYPTSAANAALRAGGGLAGLRPLFEDDLEAIRAGDERMRTVARNRSSTLRLEAFLDRPGKELQALHLKGYDDLPEQRLAARDRLGLNLTETERAKLEQQIAATEATARTLESVRLKEISIAEGVSETLDVLAPDLGAQVDRAEALVERLSDPSRLDQVEADVRAALEAAREGAGALAEDVTGRLDELPKMLRAELEQSSSGVQEVLLIIADASALESRWREAENAQDLGTISALVTDTSALAKRVQTAAGELPRWLREAGEATETVLALEVEGIEADASAALAAWVESNAVESVVQHAESYYADLREGEDIVREVLRILRIGQIPVEQVAPEVPEAFDVDIEQLQDTTLNLKRVPGADGDTVILRATLKEPGRKPVESSAEFELTHYGWHGRLSPSVVLVRPNELASGNEDFRFAPALSWMQHWRPRPEDERFLAKTLRPLQPGFGMHAIFLNFDNEPGIGLGGTLSLWNDRLQFGAGYNLSASAADEGQIYYFVGSDLIGLLQTVGIGSP